MKRVTIIITFLVSILLGTGSGHPSGKIILAEIDGKKITQEDFNAYLTLFKGNPHYTPKSTEDKKRLLNHLINRTILLETAKQEGYFHKEILKKHPAMGKMEKETLVLRAYLMDHISKKVNISPSEIVAYRSRHPGISQKEAVELLAAKQQASLFATLMKQLKKGRTIRIYPENLK